MRHNFMHFIVISIFFLASLVLFGQHAPNNNLLFKEVKKENLSQSVRSWYMSENREIGQSSSHLILREDNTWQPERLPDNHLYTLFSRQGDFFAQVTLNPREFVDHIDRELTISVFSSDWEKQFNVNRGVADHRSIPEIIISDRDGSPILGESDIGKLWFFNSQGVPVKQIELFRDYSIDLERILKIDVTENGSRIAVLATKRGSAPEGSGAMNPDADPHLFLFDSQGEELWRIELPLYSASALNISPDGSKILVNNYTVMQSGEIARKSMVFNNRGELILETDLLYKIAHFTSDSASRSRFISIWLTGNELSRIVSFR